MKAYAMLSAVPKNFKKFVKPKYLRGLKEVSFDERRFIEKCPQFSEYSDHVKHAEQCDRCSHMLDNIKDFCPLPQNWEKLEEAGYDYDAAVILRNLDKLQYFKNLDEEASNFVINFLRQSPIDYPYETLDFILSNKGQLELMAEIYLEDGNFEIILEWIKSHSPGGDPFPLQEYIARL